VGADGSDLRLAFGCGPEVLIPALRDWAPAPAVLLSYAYKEKYLSVLPHIAYRDWALDSGGFTAFYTGKPIDLAQYSRDAHYLLATDPTLTEVFTLDGAPGDWRTSLANTEYLWREGVPAIPIYHYGEPWEYLDHLRTAFPGKIAIGGAAKMRGRRKLAQVITIMQRCWPIRAHALGFGGRSALLGAPFDSCDHTNWIVAPGQYATWRSFSSKGHNSPQWRHISLPSGKFTGGALRSEVRWYLDLERLARHAWAAKFAELAATAPPWPPPRPLHADPTGVSDAVLARDRV